MANFTGENFTIPNPSHARLKVDSGIVWNGQWRSCAVRIISSGIVVPTKRQATTSGPGGGAFASNALSYTMRGFHQVLGTDVHWRAPFADVHATQYFGNGGTPGTITDVVILARK